MIEEAKHIFGMFPSLAFFDDANVKRFNQFWMLPLFVQPSLYRALKMIFPWDIDVLSPDGTIKGELGQVVGVLILAMFNAE